MTNVSVSGPIIAFHNEGAVENDASARDCPEYLRQREKAERAAAKNSTTVAGRRAHQELAQLLYAARKEAEATRQPKWTQSNDQEDLARRTVVQPHLSGLCLFVLDQRAEEP